jgi:hypothetical protein
MTIENKKTWFVGVCYVCLRKVWACETYTHIQDKGLLCNKCNPIKEVKNGK